jgi:APA family basic amino acid/polyamine antiporter
MIGSGIFIVSADIVRQVGSAGWLIAIWLLTSVITIVAAVSYGELSAMFPKAGGQYVYLKEAYNKLIAFLYGWSFFAVIQTGTIAAVGVAFSKFAAYLYAPLSDENILFELGIVDINAAQIVSIITIIFLTYLNSRGVKDSKLLQTVLTIIKILSLIGNEHSTKEIAEMLFISEKTVEKHRSNIIKKLDLPNEKNILQRFATQNSVVQNIISNGEG